jgi:prevent-host-death family protein
MKAIGVRELRQQASRYLREVELGETIEVTDRGRPVARLVPIPARGGIEDLAASGRLIAPTVEFSSLGAPMPGASGAPAPSDELTKLRDDER